MLQNFVSAGTSATACDVLGGLVNVLGGLVLIFIIFGVALLFLITFRLLRTDT